MVDVEVRIAVCPGIAMMLVMVGVEPLVGKPGIEADADTPDPCLSG